MESDRRKAERFTSDARIFILSLSDAVKAVDQIAGIKSSRYLLNLHLNVLSIAQFSQNFLLARSCNHNVCPHADVLASKDIESWVSFQMFRYSVSMNSLYSESLKKCKDYKELDKELDSILDQSRKKLEENLFQ